MDRVPFVRFRLYYIDNLSALLSLSAPYKRQTCICRSATAAGSSDDRTWCLEREEEEVNPTIRNITSG